MGAIETILGMRVKRDRENRSLTIDQQSYIEKILDRFGHQNCKPVDTPAYLTTPTTTLTSSSSSPTAHPSSSNTKVTIENYSCAIGSIAYLANATRPDIANAVNMAARDQSQPTSTSVLKVKRILHYLRGTSTTGITYNSTSKSDREVTLTAYTDSDWAGDKTDAKSTTGFVLKLAHGPISWISNKQSIVTHSSSEAEYVATSETAREIVWMRSFLEEIKHPQPITTLFIDSSVAMQMATAEGHHDRSKHINVKHHYIREKIAERVITLAKVDTSDNEADILTKPLPSQQFNKLKQRIMNINPSTTQ
jgi:hypothetical protein